MTANTYPSDQYEEALDIVVNEHYQLIHDYFGRPDIQADILDGLMRTYAPDVMAGRAALSGTFTLSDAA